MENIIPFEINHKLGVIPYTKTGEELVASIGAPITQQQTFVDQTFFDTPILMQGKSPECGGFSFAFYLQYLEKLTTQLSGSFAYAYDKTVDGVPNVEGTTIKAIGDCGHSSGTCDINLFPDDGNVSINPNGTQTLFDKATPEAISNAVARNGYIPLFLTDLSWEGLQTAIQKYGVVLVEAQVGKEWWTSQYGKVVPIGQTSWNAEDLFPLVPPKQVIDSHFFCLGGKFDANEIHFANSWSEQWGDKGFGYFGKDYIPFIQNAIVFYKKTPAIQKVIEHPTLTQTEKNSIIQQIIKDMEEVVSLIKKQL